MRKVNLFPPDTNIMKSNFSQRNWCNQWGIWVKIDALLKNEGENNPLCKENKLSLKSLCPDNRQINSILKRFFFAAITNKKITFTSIQAFPV